jgi:hypothetical protein
MQNYRNAVLAYTESLRVTKTKYKYNGKKSPPINATTIKLMAPLAQIDPKTGRAALTPKLKKAVSDAEARLG